MERASNISEQSSTMCMVFNTIEGMRIHAKMKMHAPLLDANNPEEK